MSVPGLDFPWETLLVEQRLRAAWITLNRPHALNATTRTMLEELREVFAIVQRTPDIRAAVITGAGKAFCIGSDVSFLADAFGAGGLPVFRDYLASINLVLAELEELSVPTVAMVNGRARAGGFEMLMACDIVLMADDAKIGDAHTPFGHMPGAGATQRLPRKIGYQRAFEIICSGRWLDASEAVSCGIAMRAVPTSELRSTTEELVSSFADKTRESLGYIKRAMIRGADLPLRDAIALESSCYLEYLATCPAPAAAFRQNQARRQQGLAPVAEPFAAASGSLDGPVGFAGVP